MCHHHSAEISYVAHGPATKMNPLEFDRMVFFKIGPDVWNLSEIIDS